MLIYLQSEKFNFFALKIGFPFYHVYTMFSVLTVSFLKKFLNA
jgi:hypothetical protein